MLLPFRTLRSRLLLLVLMAVVPSLALMLHNFTEQRRTALERVREDVLETTRVVAITVGHVREDARRLLVTVAEEMERHGDDPDYLNSYLENLHRKFTEYVNIGVVDRKGLLKYSAIRPGGTVDYSDRLWFRRAIRTRSFAVGELTVGRIVAKKVLAFGYPIQDGKGETRLVAFAAIDLEHLAGKLAKIRRYDKGAILVLDGKGTILSRHPGHEQWAGKAAPDAAIVRTILSRREGVAEVTGVDGVQRLYAFAPVDGTAGALFAAYGIPREVVVADMNRLLARDLAWMGLAAALALAAAWVGGDFFIVRRVKALLEAQQRLERGDLASRADVAGWGDEISVLASGFNSMAEALQRRETEQLESSDALRAKAEELAAAHRRAEESLAILKTVMDSAPIGFAFVAPDFRLVHVNPVFARINTAFSGIAPERQPGRPVAELIPNSWPDVEPIFRRVMETREPVTDIEFSDVIDPAAGEMSHWLLNYFPVGGDDIPIGLGIIGIDITERKRGAEELKESNRQLQSINRIIATCTATLNLHDILERILDEALEITGLEGGTICLVDSDETLRLAAQREASGAIIDDLSTHEVKVGECLCGECARNHRPLILPDRQAVLEFASRESMRGDEIHFHAAFPLVTGGKCEGVLCVFTRTARKPSERSLKLFETITGQIALAIVNARLYEETVGYAATLEERVGERTAELERMNRLFVGRELRMMELKKRIAELGGEEGSEP